MAGLTTKEHVHKWCDENVFNVTDEAGNNYNIVEVEDLKNSL